MIERFTLRSSMYSAYSVERPLATRKQLERSFVNHIHSYQIRQCPEDAFRNINQHVNLYSYELVYTKTGNIAEVLLSQHIVIWNSQLIIDGQYFSDVKAVNGLILGKYYLTVKDLAINSLARYEEAAGILRMLSGDSETGINAFERVHGRGVELLTKEVIEERTRKRELAIKKDEMRKRIDAMKSVRIAKARKSGLEVLREVLAKAGEQVHPGRWDIEETTYDKKEALGLVIYLPEVKITNSKKQKHTLHDLYVIFVVDGDGKPMTTLRGRRGTLSYAEFISNYPQSHLQTGAMRTEGNFCLGDANILTLLSDMRSKSYFMDPAKWVRRLEGILFQIESFMSWESLEGTPWHYIENIKIPGQEQINVEFECNNLIKKLDLNDPPPMVFVRGRGFQLSSNTEQFEDWIMKYSNVKQYKDDHGAFYTDSKAKLPREDFEVPDSKPIMFRGQVLKRIVKVKKHEVQERKEYCHREVKDQFVAWANRELERSFAERNLRSIFRGILTTKTKTKAASYGLEDRDQTKAKSEFKGLLKNFKAVSTISQSGVVGNSVV